MQYSDEIEGFGEYLRFQNLAEGTIKNYVYQLRKIPLDEPLTYLSNNRSKTLMINAWRKYLRYLRSIGKINAEELLNQLDTYKPPKRRGKLRKGVWYPRKEWNQIITKIPSSVGKFGAYIQFNFGLRIGEIVNLRISEDIDFKAMLIHVQPHSDWTPKHGRSRSIPMTGNQKRIIQRFIKNRPTNVLHDFLLFNSRGNPLIERTLQRYYAKVNLKSHDLRRSFCKVLYYNSKQDIKFVSELMGHANVSITSEYLGLDSEEIQEKYSRAMT